MVFEGKPLHEKKAEPKAAPPPKATPKKTHRFRNFVLTTLTLGSVIYGVGAYYALENDDVHDIFVDYVPLGDQLIALIEDRRFKQRFTSLSAVTQATSEGSSAPRGLDSVRVSTSGATWKAVDEPLDKPGAINIMKPGPHLSASKDGATPVERKKVVKEQPRVSLPTIPVPINADDHIKSSIAALNEFIKSINESAHSPEHVEKISKEVISLAQSITEIKDTFKAQLSEKIEAEVSKAGTVVEGKTTELRDAVAALEEKWTQEFYEEKKRLQSSYEERLKNEVDAASKVISTHAQNQLKAVHAEREKLFAAEITERVEKERDGRLANLEELAKTLAEIEEMTVQADQVILESDKTAQLHIAVGRLQSVLAADKPVALGPYIEAISKAAGSDPLLQAALNSIPSEVYDEGVLTPAQLAARFHLLEPEIRKASLLPPNAGIAGHLGSLIFSKLLWAKSSSAVGDDVESVLSRADVALSEGRIVDAVGEVNTLKGWPKRLAQDWLAEGRKRSEVEFVVDVLAEEGKLWGI